MQTTSHVLMVRPALFAANPETLASNAFQRPDPDSAAVHARAVAEFDRYAEALDRVGVDVLVAQDRLEPHRPDALFPNNWVSFHEDGTVVLYPMEAPNRRLERREEILDLVGRRFLIRRRVDLSGHEARGRFLEGTGSMVLDREHRLAYLCRSSRSHRDVVEEFTRELGYEPVWFSGTDGRGQAVYHTNVMMAVGREFAVVCLDAIRDRRERAQVAAFLRVSGKRILDISRAQMGAFAGNVLELKGRGGAPVLVLSRQAWDALNEGQRRAIQDRAIPLVAAIDTIERCGGGGVRCMVAEIHLPPRLAADAALAG